MLIWQRPVGRPKLRFSNHIKSVIRKCDIPEADLEQLAADRDSWRSTCATGLESLAAASDQAASDRRVHRHAAAQAVRVVPACPQCGRVCASDFGLRSHLRICQRPQWQFHYSARHRRHQRTTTSKQPSICEVHNDRKLNLRSQWSLDGLTWVMGGMISWVARLWGQRLKVTCKVKCLTERGKLFRVLGALYEKALSKHCCTGDLTPRISMFSISLWQCELQSSRAECWLGHIIRRPSNRLPRCLLYGKLLIGQRPVGRPKLCFFDHIKSDMPLPRQFESNLLVHST